MRTMTFLLLVLILLLTPLSTVLAAGHLPPVPIHAPRDPLPIPNSSVLSPSHIYNDLIVPNLPAPSMEADKYELKDKPGILKDVTNLASGMTLSYNNVAKPKVCVGFNDRDKWQGEVWTNYYAGWGPFAVNDGGFYQSKNVVFAMERSVGPVDGKGYALKVSSTQPYAAGYGSPIIRVPAGSMVEARVRYLIFNHGNIAHDKQWAYDWASMGVKPDAYGDSAVYVNGYMRGQWALLSNTVKAGPSGMVMILLQGSSPASLNSNIYFDDVELLVDGTPMALWDKCYD